MLWTAPYPPLFIPGLRPVLLTVRFRGRVIRAPLSPETDLQVWEWKHSVKVPAWRRDLEAIGPRDLEVSVMMGGEATGAARSPWTPSECVGGVPRG